jgi:putative ABC transport system permease protein
MADALTNHRMYWRIVRRMLFGNRARLLVILLALGAGATVTAALLNLEADAKRRLTTEFTVFGPNVVISPKQGGAASADGQTLSQAVASSVPHNLGGARVQLSPVLYVIAKVSQADSQKVIPAVLAGGKSFGVVRAEFSSHDQPSSPAPKNYCRVGVRLAEELRDSADTGILELRNGDRTETCQAARDLRSNGSAEDDQIWTDLATAQKLANLPGRVSAIELIVPGKPHEIQSYVSELQHRLPDVEVRPVRQFTEAQAKIYGRISGLLNLTVGIVLVLTALCVMAAMANVAIERRNDVGLMKAIGGATRRVLRLFLAEAAVLGLAGGVIGGGLGILVSMYLGKAVFGLAARPRWVVYPVSMGLTLIVAIVAAFPLRRLAGVRPASVFRGEA